MLVYDFRFCVSHRRLVVATGKAQKKDKATSSSCSSTPVKSDGLSM